MANGSFDGLYTFGEAAKIYGLDDSCLRKRVARGKFVIGEDVKKMGATWIITEKALVNSFGVEKLQKYKEGEIKQSILIMNKILYFYHKQVYL